MEEDHVNSSPEEESVYDFVRRSVARDRIAEAEARKALVNGLVGRVVKADLTTRPGSIISPRKGRPPSHTSEVPADAAKSPSRASSKTKRTTWDEKLRALTEVACRSGDPRSLRVVRLLRETARELDLAIGTMELFWTSLSRTQKDLLLYGKESRAASGKTAESVEREPAGIGAALTGAIAVLRFRRKPVNSANLAELLAIEQHLVKKYLVEHPESSG